MTWGYARVLTFAAAIGSGLVAGVFFAFSTFVMQALGRLPAAQGLSAMQAVNRAAPSPAFMTALLGTSVVCLGLGVSALTRLDEPGAAYQLAGSGLYLLGLVVTVAYHIPHNNALDLVDPAGAGAADTWRHYLTAWTAWNHVRTLTSLAAAVVLTLALRVD
jgi:uncharacterized membrane protein